MMAVDGNNHFYKVKKMFRKNTSHLQSSLFGIASQLPEAKLKKLKKSREYDFYRLVFCKIKEEDFAVLYSDLSSRPNAPVNSLVASIILMYHNNLTTEQLFNRIDFDLLTHTALGLDTLEETPFCPVTFFNFQNRLLWHFSQTGENLIEGVFDSLTQQQLKALKRKTNIQCSDSFMAMSNIRSYSRTQLLIEMLSRLYRALSDENKLRFKELLAPYIKQSSGQYIYNLERSAIPHELENLGAYGSEDNDKKMEELETTHAQTAVRGRKAKVSMEIEEVSEEKFTKSFNHKGKLKVRGLFKTMVYAHAMAISINSGRVWRYIDENPDFFGLLNLLCGILPCLFAKHSRSKLRKVIIRYKRCCWLEPQQYFAQAA